MLQSKSIFANKIKSCPFNWILLCTLIFLNSSCFSPVQDTWPDLSEFESVWQFLKIYSIYQDSSIYTGRIPHDPFTFSSPQEILHAVNDTLTGHHYTDYEGGYYSKQTASSSSAFDDEGSVTFSAIGSTGKISIIHGFASGVTYSQFKKCMPAASQYSNLVVDLRGNGGGSIEESDSIIEAFLPAGCSYILARERLFKDGTAQTISWHPWKTQREAFPELKNKKITVWVDGNTASASEILAIALKDCLGASIIGKKTYGKGIGQIIISRNERQNLKITYLQFRRINGSEYHHIGIQPDSVLLGKDLSPRLYGGAIPNDYFKVIYVD